MEVFKELLVLMVVVWTVAVILRRLGWPTVMDELVMGVVLRPAILGWVEANEIIHVLAEMGIFFLMLHTGVETHPRQSILGSFSRPSAALWASLWWEP